MAKAKRQKVDIKGEPYTITRNDDGWQVTATKSKIDRIGRTYQVRRAENGQPRDCSCPDYANRQRVCKHMEAVAKIVYEADREVKVVFLEHPTKPRCYRFASMTSGAVRYQLWEVGRAGPMTVLSRKDAVSRYRFLRDKQGYSEFGFMSKQTAGQTDEVPGRPQKADFISPMNRHRM